MATQAYPYMVISDGTTTVTIQDGSGGATNYPLVRDGWAPAIAGLRASPLTGYTPYEDVVETFTIEINGATATLALGRLATLTKLLDQAARWYRGENVTAVLLKIAPHGSTISSTAAPLQVAILGGAVGSSGVRLSPRWDEVGRNFVIPNVEVSVIRRGLWLHTTTEANTPSAADNGDLVTFTLTARDTKGPCKVAITNLVSGGGLTGYAAGGFLLLAEPVGGSASIEIETAESATTGAAYTSVAGGLNARNTNVLRYTPAGTTEAASLGTTAPTMPATTRLMAIFANIRPSATVAFTVRMQVNSAIFFQYTPYVTIAADADQVPRWNFLGVVAIQGTVILTKFLITAASASSSIDIDTVVYCDAEATQVLALNHPPTPTLAVNPVALDTGTATFDHRLLTSPTPSVKNSDDASLPYTGDAVFTNAAATLYGVLLLTGGGTSVSGQEYRQANTGTDALLANTWTVTRSTAYLVPQ